ncbi:MAG: vWA domain-containing protein, partial [Verrucomicrobiota bacterium]
KFGAANTDEQRFLIVMSDGHDDSSVLAGTLPDAIIASATNARVQLYCVGYGAIANTNVLLRLATETGGRYFAAANASDVAAQFALLLKDLNSQYFLRWATLQRGAAFQPMFQVTVDGVTASYNLDFPEDVVDDSVVPQTTPPTMKMVKIDRSTTPPTTNALTAFAPDYVPNAWSNNVQVGELRLATDAVTNVSSVTLRAFYTPRFIQEIRLHYRANYPCTPKLLSDGPGNILDGWSLTQTNDGLGGQWLTISSDSTSNSLPYGIRGDLVGFQFQHLAVPSGKDAFSLFEVDNSIYTNAMPLGRSFTLNTNLFITVYPATPPLGTPVPWLRAHGFSGDPASAELSDPNGNGMFVWQEYLAGLDPNALPGDAHFAFVISSRVIPQPGPPQIAFNTVVGRRYRVESATTLGFWTVLEDEIAGTGNVVSVADRRNLAGVSAVYYRAVVY